MTKLLIIHVFLSLLLGLLGGRKTSKQERLCNIAWALFLPIGGAILVLVFFVLRNRVTKEVDLTEDDEIDSVILFTDRVDFDKETDVIALEDTLLLSNQMEKRRHFLEALKKDTSKYIDKLKIALKDEDVETSHYAASAISEIRRNLDLNIQSFSVEYEKMKDDIEFSIAYEKAIHEYVKSGLADQLAVRRMLVDQVNVLSHLISLGQDGELYYERVIDASFKLGNMSEGLNYCEKHHEKHKSESSFLHLMNYYYLIKDTKNFYDMLEKMLNSSLLLSSHTLDMVRLWRNEIQYEN